MKLSVNLNKIALIRNSRGNDNPSLTDYAYKCIELGVDGLTLHPRPDHRHATSQDAINLSKLCKENNIEFNLEGNPFSMPKEEFIGFQELCAHTNPEQVTLVPDDLQQITSDHGWQPGFLDNKLRSFIGYLKDSNARTSLFIDANIDSVEYAAQMGFDRIEIYTGPFADFLKDEDFVSFNISKDEIAKCIKKARSLNLGINAGHDLNLENLSFFARNIPQLSEVSIGHALISDALYLGIENAIQMYKRLL